MVSECCSLLNSYLMDRQVSTVYYCTNPFPGNVILLDHTYNCVKNAFTMRELLTVQSIAKSKL